MKLMTTQNYIKPPFKLSIFTTASYPHERGDMVDAAMTCYAQLADEIIYMEGGDLRKQEYDLFWVDEKVRIIKHHWPQEFKWTLIGEQFQRGYEAASGNWVIHSDLDFIFHEEDYQKIREVLEQSDAPAVMFYKKQFVLPDRFNVKSRLVLAVNKGKYGDRIRFDSGGDLCQPSLDGKEIRIEDLPDTQLGFWNYEKILKTKEQISDDVGRMDRAYFRHFGKYLYGDGTDQGAFEGWMEMMRGRLSKPHEHIPLEKHPKIMHNIIKELMPNQFGYSAFGLEKNDYVKGLAQ